MGSLVFNFAITHTDKDAFADPWYGRQQSRVLFTEIETFFTVKYPVMSSLLYSPYLKIIYNRKNKFYLLRTLIYIFNETKVK